MDKSEYPYKAWMLQPAGKPVEVTVTGDGRWYEGHRTINSGKTVPKESLHETKNAAISSGLEEVKRRQSDIDKRQERLNKFADTLKKHSGS